MGQGLILMADGQLKPQAVHLQDHSSLPCLSPLFSPACSSLTPVVEISLAQVAESCALGPKCRT